MDKIFSINTIKNVFAALGAKTSDDNYGVALLDKTTAEPKGLMGMNDLQSLLGVPFVSNITITDLNSEDCMGNITSYFSTNTVSNLPGDVPISSSTFCLYVCFKKSLFAVQCLYVSDSNMYIRFVWGADRSRPWKKVTLA